MDFIFELRIGVILIIGSTDEIVIIGIAIGIVYLPNSQMHRFGLAMTSSQNLLNKTTKISKKPANSRVRENSWILSRLGDPLGGDTY